MSSRGYKAVRRSNADAEPPRPLPSVSLDYHPGDVTPQARRRPRHVTNAIALTAATSAMIPRNQTLDEG